MSANQSTRERGQSMVIIAVFMVVLIGVLALVLDGGLGYAKRRQAQNAADAAALAGADVLCAGDGEVAARATAKDYVVQNGGLLPDDADITFAEREITVTASVTHPTFFAGIFGSDEILAKATATAGCFTPCSASMLPVAWSCHPPAGEELEDTCNVLFGEPGDPNPPLYIIMDSNDLPADIGCQDPLTGEPEGYFDCDLYPLPDGDGVIDLLHGTPERSWIDLDGGTDMGTNDLFYFIEGVDEYTITFPTWFAAIVANRAAAYNALEDMVGQIVLVPVFDNYCFNSDPRYNSPPCTYDTGDIFPGDDLFPVNPDDPDADTSEQIGQTHYRVVSLSPFHITCIQEPSGPIVEPGMDPSIDTCPGLQRAFDLNETLFEDLLNPGEMQRIYSIEGYFVEAYAGTGACDTPYAGVYTLYLK